MVPPAVWGRWRWVTMPPTFTFAPSGSENNPSVVHTPNASRRWRTNRVGCPSAETPVAHRSAWASSHCAMPGRRGASAPVTMPASLSGVLCHRANRPQRHDG